MTPRHQTEEERHPIPERMPAPPTMAELRRRSKARHPSIHDKRQARPPARTDWNLFTPTE